MSDRDPAGELGTVEPEWDEAVDEVASQYPAKSARDHVAGISDPVLQTHILGMTLVEQAIAAPARAVPYDERTIDAAQHAIRDLILSSKFRETASALNRAIAAIEKLRA